MDIDISIEQLILYGIDLPRGQQQMLRAALEGEFQRLLAEGGFTSQLAGVGVQPRLSAGEINLPAGDTAPDPVRLGIQIAQAVYGGMSR